MMGRGAAMNSVSDASCRSPNALKSARAKATKQQPRPTLAEVSLLGHALTVCYQVKAAHHVPIHSMNCAVEEENWWMLASSRGFARQHHHLDYAC